MTRSTNENMTHTQGEKSHDQKLEEDYENYKMKKNMKVNTIPTVQQYCTFKNAM